MDTANPTRAERAAALERWADEVDPDALVPADDMLEAVSSGAIDAAFGVSSATDASSTFRRTLKIRRTILVNIANTCEAGRFISACKSSIFFL